MTNATQAARLHEAVQTYFDALHTCDTDLLDQVFHPAASLFDVDDGPILVHPLADWRQDVANRPSPASRGQAQRTAIEAID